MNVKTTITLRRRLGDEYVVTKLTNRLTPRVGKTLTEVEVQALIDNERDCTITVLEK